MPLLSSLPLIQALTNYRQLGRRRFHVPGHAGHWLGESHQQALEPLGFHESLLASDLTELDGLDALAHPEDVLADSQAMVADGFQVRQSFYCVNGATVGIQAAMLAAFQPGQKVLVPRNAHRAVVAGLVLAGLSPVWIVPEWLPAWGLWGGLSAKSVETALAQTPEIAGVLLTHPTYDGLPSEVADIARLCQQTNRRLIVDEAHGCLWPLASDCFPPSAVTVQGVDAVIHSLHKTGGSLTQTALLHLPHHSHLNPEAVQQALNHLQTTSPSYLLMASMEAACHWLFSQTGRERIRQSVTQANQLVAAINGLPAWRAMTIRQDPMRLVIRHATLDPDSWAEALETRPNGISYEAVGTTTALYLWQLGLTEQDASALLDGLQTMEAPDESLPWFPLVERPGVLLPRMVMSPRDAFFAPGQWVTSDQATGRIAKQTLVRCPPGIPVLSPGERIEATHLPHLPERVWVVA